jgi:Flp pilus assembly protein TadG
MRKLAMIARTAGLTTGLKKLCRRFMTDRAGNIAMTFAIVSVPLLGAIGAGIDYMRALNMHREIQASLDAALVAAVKDVGTKDDKAIKQQLANWLAAEAVSSGAYQLDASSVVIDTSNQIVTATVRASVDTTFMRILGKESVPVAVQASIMGGETITKSAFSMYLVLDQSGSMGEPTNTTYTTKCGIVTCTKKYTKMESLKLAVASLLTQFDTADPARKYVRTAAISYDDRTRNPSPMEWGTSAAASYVDDLRPDGLTDSSGAMHEAYNLLKKKTGSSSENAQHKAKNGLVPEKFIILMTDGENTKQQGYWVVDNPEADAATKKTCDDAKAKGIKIYTVAFMAPDRGKALLSYCASGSDYYFDVENTAQIVAAFQSIGEKASKNLVRLTN